MLYLLIKGYLKELHNVGVCVRGRGTGKEGERENEIKRGKREVGVNENMYINIETP